VPPFIAAETAAAVLRVGKSIHFLRACCKDAKWETLSAAARAVADARGGLEYADGSSVALDGTIREAAAAVDAHLLRVMVDQFQLMEHSSAICCWGRATSSRRCCRLWCVESPAQVHEEGDDHMATRLLPP